VRKVRAALHVQQRASSSLVSQCLPEVDLRATIGARPDKESWHVSRTRPAPIPPVAYPPSVSADELDGGEVPIKEEEESTPASLAEWLNRLHVAPGQHRAFGKASDVEAVRDALRLKAEQNGVDDIPMERRFERLASERPQFFSILPVSRLKLFFEAMGGLTDSSVGGA
jgi:hypothetical protein